jgi:hypothetical protein
MTELNWIIVLSTSLIPLVVGFAYYNDKTFGKAWMKHAGLDEAQLRQGSMARIFGFTWLLGLLLAIFIMPIVLHAIHVMSLVADAGAGSAAQEDAAAYLAKYGGNFRTFKHGAFHGFMTAIVGVWPVVGINALFERRGWRYTAIHVGYWAIVFALMGGVICAFA